MTKDEIKTLIKNSKNVKSNDLLGNIQSVKPGDKWKIELEGEVKDMANQGFTKMQMQQLADLMDKKLQPIIERLDRIEGLPTIKKELNELEKQDNN